MTRVKSFTLNKKGFCVVDTGKNLYLYTPTKHLKNASLPQLRKTLIEEVGSEKDAGLVGDILNFCSFGRGNYFLHHTNGN